MKRCCLPRSAQGVALLLASTVLISGCADLRPARDTGGDGPPSGRHDHLAALPDAVPRAEPRSARGNPETYEVFGKTYRVRSTAAGYDEVGNASWYGRKFHGRDTSSGEPFDMYALSAAHREVPIPTYVEVTNLENQRKTVVRVNDRGPFHSDRILDLSYAAAVKLGFHNDGTARVRVRVVAPAAPAVQTVAIPQPRPQTAVATSDQWFLQAGAFSRQDSAQTLRAQLVTLSPAPTFTVQVPSDRLYRVRMGPFASRTEAERTRQVLAAARFPNALILSAEKVIRDGSCLTQC